MNRDDAQNVPPVVTPADVVSQEVDADMHVAAPDGEDQSIPRVRLGFIVVYGVTYFGFFLVLFMPALFSLAYKVQLIDPTNKETSLGLVVGISSIVLLPIGPMFGALSDSSRFRWGRRRPFLVIGLAVVALSAFVIAVAPNIPVVMAGYVIAQIGGALVSTALNPALAERVPPSQRGKLGALSGVAASVAGVCATLLGSFLTGNILLLFLLPVAVFAVGVILWLIVIPDSPAPPQTASRSIGGALRSLIFDPRKHRDFAWVWVGKLSLQIGTAFFTTYQLYFLLDRLGYSAEAAGRQLAVVGGLALLAAIGFTIVGGLLSDRLRRRKPFIYVASALIAVGMTVAAIAPDFIVYSIGGVLIAAGTGAFNSVDLALASEILPDKAESAKWMSIYQVAGSISTGIGPVLAPLLLAIGSSGANYTVLFISGGVLALGAAITASRVKGAR